ncbi:MAG: protoporphyrinogen/coproporphyrinogen oxidase [Sphingobacterium sp.]
MNLQVDHLILGAGVTGLAAGAMLKPSTVILEKEDRPGGLVRSKCFNGGYWFDNVLHLLHFSDQNVMRKIRELMGDLLFPCPPEAWIVTPSGTLKYPFQFNLGGLNEKDRDNCLDDYAKAYYGKPKKRPSHYREYLETTFGESMCKLFYFPYNEKLYKYPLEKISCENLVWNLHRPSFKEVLAGGFYPNVSAKTYNSNAFYPRPPEDSNVRGMELLSVALANKVENIELNSQIYKIDPVLKTVYTKKNGLEATYTYQAGCLSTIPLPFLIEMCTNVPESLRKSVQKLQYTNVVSIGISIKGDRPKNMGLWRYYTDPDLPFTRLIFMTEFDPLNAPPEGWSLLAEVTVSPKEQASNYEGLEKSVVEGLKKIKLLDGKSRIVGVHSWVATPAYVIFTKETEKIISQCTSYLAENGITSLGRYGSWEYSSMFKNIKDGFEWASRFDMQ